MTLEIKSSGERFEELVSAISEAGDDQGLRSTAIQNLREYHTDVSGNEIAYSKELEDVNKRVTNLAESNEFLTGRLAQQPTTPAGAQTNPDDKPKNTTENLTFSDIF